MTSPQAEPSAQALGESLAALAAQVADLRGQIMLISQRLDRAGLRGDLDLAAGLEELARTVADTLLGRPGPPGVHGAASRAATVGRCRTAPALRRLRAAGLLAQPHPCHLGAIHLGRRMASRLRQPATRSGPRAGILRSLAPRHHAPHRRHDPGMRAGMRDPTPFLVTRVAGCSAPE